MALTFPLSHPTTGVASVEFRTVNAVSTSQSPFTYKQQIVSHGGERWEASIELPPMRRDTANAWKAFLTALRGPTGTFLLGDPMACTPRGTVSSLLVSGVAGNSSIAVEMTGTLLAGDYIQLGTGSAARLHQVLEDQSGNGAIEIWPTLRSNYTLSEAIYTSPKGVFRLASNVSSWSINNASIYGISFEAVEAITG